MSTNFPTSLDAFTNPSATDRVGVDVGSRTHSEFHADTNDAIEALQAKVGVDSSAVTTSHDYKLSEVTSTDKAVGKSATQTLTNKTLTSPVISTISNTGTLTLPTSTDTLVGRATTDTLTNKTLTTPVIGSFTNATHTHADSAGGGQLNATNVFSAGTVPTARLGSGTANGTTFLRGDQSWATPEFTGKFGGTGADSALTVSSGNTNIDLGGARVVVKNYSSISITGTGSVTFINPHANGTFILLKCSGNVTLTSSAAPMLDARGCGSAGAAAYSDISSSAVESGATGSVGQLPTTYLKTNFGTNFVAPSTAGTGGAISTLTLNQSLQNTFYHFMVKYPMMFVGGGAGIGGGATSGAHNVSVNAAPNGGGALVLEVFGSWEFTTSGGISVAGSTTSTAGTINSGNVGIGGAGGGGGGSFLAVVGSIVSNTGTITATGGTGANAVLTGSQQAYGGGGGGSYAGAGSNGTNSNVNGTKTGGDGAAGLSYGVNLNTEFI